ncbi:MAG: hypothetical protein IKF71_04470 [Bacilli bacterium]|nr:hypothetical protein [Bacilli bacterium]
MRIDTYNTEAFKFGVVSLDNINMENVHKIEKAMEESKTLKSVLSEERIIDFSQVDGLTLEELSTYPSIMFKDSVYFVMYDHIPNSGKKQIIRYIIPIEKTEQSKEKPIDEAVLDYFERNYSNLGNSERARAHCFMERYKYGTKKATNEHIQRLINKRK